uniref:Uncharacterized protein n=1 Tax=Moschus moschiferus TaxID=68415 RepID=A0A8C6DJL5_MOSMO
ILPPLHLQLSWLLACSLCLACMTTMTSLSTPWTSALSSGRCRIASTGMHRSSLLTCCLCSPTAINTTLQTVMWWPWHESYRMCLSSVTPKCQMNPWNQGLYQSPLPCPLAWPSHLQSPPARRVALEFF